MLDQRMLNQLSLKEASKIISDTLISERIALGERRAELDSLREQYQEDYIAANDGDARENAPLEQAIQNLRTITGDILSVTKKYQSLDAVEDRVYLNATYDYDIILEVVRIMTESSQRMLFNVFGVQDINELSSLLVSIEYDELSQKVGVFDEWYGETVLSNMKAEYPEDHVIWKSRTAFDKTVADRRAGGEMALEYKLLMEFGRLKEMKAMPLYNYCGKVVMYTTVRLKTEDSEYTYRIYPKDLSFIDDGVIAANSRLATALMGKRKGDKVSVRHASKGTIIIYEIVDIY